MSAGSLIRLYSNTMFTSEKACTVRHELECCAGQPVLLKKKDEVMYYTPSVPVKIAILRFENFLTKDCSHC
jgi:hypothetical protein